MRTYLLLWDSDQNSAVMPVELLEILGIHVRISCCELLYFLKFGIQTGNWVLIQLDAARVEDAFQVEAFDCLLL